MAAPDRKLSDGSPARADSHDLEGPCSDSPDEPGVRAQWSPYHLGGLECAASRHRGDPRQLPAANPVAAEDTPQALSVAPKSSQYCALPSLYPPAQLCPYGVVAAWIPSIVSSFSGPCGVLRIVLPRMAPRRWNVSLVVLERNRIPPPLCRNLRGATRRKSKIASLICVGDQPPIPVFRNRRLPP